MRVRLKSPVFKSGTYADLSMEKVYEVIGIEADDFRIMNDRGQPYLYPPVIFEMIDFAQPPDWVIEIGEGGETYAYPPVLARRGFFEDYFDGVPEVIAEFKKVTAQLVGGAAEKGPP